MAQVGDDGHALGECAGTGEGQCGLVHRHVQRQGRAVAPLLQRVGLHHLVGKHGDLVAGHVHRGEAVAGDLVDGAVGCNGQGGRGNVDAQRDRAGAEPLDGQGIVNLGGGRVVHRERSHAGQRQLVSDGWSLQRRETRAPRKVLEQKALPVKLVRIGNGPHGLEHDQRCGMRLLGRLDHGFVFRRVFVGLEQDFVQLVPNGLRALACCQLSHPGVDLRQHGLFFLDSGQRLLHLLLGCLFEATLARTAEVVRRIEKRQQHGRLLLQRG